jgi:hypothetical protein
VPEVTAALRPWLLASGLALLGLAFAFGWVTGRDQANGRNAAALAAQQRETMKAAELASRKEADRLFLAAELDRQALSMEDQANADPDDGSCPLAAGRVLRLRQR